MDDHISSYWADLYPGTPPPPELPRELKPFRLAQAERRANWIATAQALRGQQQSTRKGQALLDAFDESVIRGREQGENEELDKEARNFYARFFDWLLNNPGFDPFYRDGENLGRFADAACAARIVPDDGLTRATFFNL